MDNQAEGERAREASDRPRRQARGEEAGRGLGGSRGSNCVCGKRRRRNGRSAAGEGGMGGISGRSRERLGASDQPKARPLGLRREGKTESCRDFLIRSKARLGGKMRVGREMGMGVDVGGVRAWAWAWVWARARASPATQRNPKKNPCMGRGGAKGYLIGAPPHLPR